MKTFFEDKMEESGRLIENEENADFPEFREFCETGLVELVDLFCERNIKSLETGFDNIGIKLTSRRDVHPSIHTPDLKTDTVEIETGLDSIKSKYLGILHLLNEKGLPFVNIGENVKEGQVLGLVETVNILNEVKSTVDGTLIKVLEDDGRPVEYGQQLFVIETQ
ncbi:MAG: hypothetical protein K8T10_04530 [Candidatus Eremiobacteraeota bacterium]|nr:hypothetical protein [Candidatus Eremiobacteraeota bacterium]